MSTIFTKTLGGFITILSILIGLIPISAGAKPYKGAEIFTAEGELYGKFVIRMRAAKASGVISNFFLWKDGSELDSIFWEEVDVEVFGKDNATSWQSNIISGLGTKQYSEEVHREGYSFGDAYHTFALEWTPNQVRWLVDDRVVRTTNGGQASQLTSPAQMRINFWPPNNPGWVGNWNEGVLPLNMFINWVEYHSWNNGRFELEWRDDFDYLDAGRWGTADWTFDENRADFAPANVVVRNGYLVLAMTREGQEGYQGNPPVDVGQSSSAASSSPSSSSSSRVSSASSLSSSVASSSSSSGATTSGGALSYYGLLTLLLMMILIRLRPWSKV